MISEVEKFIQGELDIQKTLMSKLATTHITRGDILFKDILSSIRNDLKEINNLLDEIIEKKEGADHV